ncbi:hypothetical protein ElyMa_004469800 [Elysia marginata]|uniref:Uncharacterized protein n=1 Tax=Elysia marginata TaxID=1093978 RepID=A0AAV4HJ96_9GAST|nr:hypothetical protein ElyMa_004469800 [Elysia marginata]
MLYLAYPGHKPFFCLQVIAISVKTPNTRVVHNKYKQKEVEEEEEEELHARHFSVNYERALVVAAAAAVVVVTAAAAAAAAAATAEYVRSW